MQDKPISQAEIQEKEVQLHFLRNFIELSSDIFCNLNKNGYCLYVNKAFEKLTGYSSEEVIGAHFNHFIHPDYREATLEAFGKRINNVVAPALINCVLTKSGSEVFVEWKGKNDENGSVFLAGINVTERVRFSNEVEEKNRLFASISQAMPVVIYLLNLKQEKLEFISDHVYHLSGYTVKECLDMNRDQLLGLIPQLDMKQVTGSFMKLVNDPATDLVSNFFRLKHKNGEFRRVSSREIIFKRDAKGIATHLLGSITDVTEQFNAERYQEAIVRLKELQQKRTQKIRSLSLLQGQEEERKRLARELHDGIGQLLTAIRIKLNDIEESSGNLQVDKKIADVKEIVLKTIKEARGISYALVPIDLYDFGLDPAVKQLCDTAQANSGITVSYTSNINSERLNPTIEIELYRIIQEAMNNSIKYSAAESIDINVIHNEKQGSLKVLIIDDGNGFDYDPDYIYKKNKTRSFGLRNMNERTRIINGKLNIISRKGEGCVISVEVPLKLNEI